MPSLFHFPYPVTFAFATRLPRASRGTKTPGMYANNSYFGTDFLTHAFSFTSKGTSSTSSLFITFQMPRWVHPVFSNFNFPISSFRSTIPSLFCTNENSPSFFSTTSTLFCSLKGVGGPAFSNFTSQISLRSPEAQSFFFPIIDNRLLIPSRSRFHGAVTILPVQIISILSVLCNTRLEVAAPKMEKRKFLFASLSGLIGDIAWQVLKEGHDVSYFIDNEKERDIADGFVPKSKDWEKDAKWADIVVFDDTLGQGARAQAL